MKTIELLEAISRVGDEFVAELSSELGGDSRKKTGGYKKALRTILIAAVLTGLLGAAAYAAGWFGLGGLTIGRSQYGADILSLQGLADSPEAKGAAQWLEYYEEHKFDDYDREEAQSYYEKYGLVGCNTPAAAAKVEEICEKYGLGYLGKLSVPEGEKAFYQAAGTGRLAISHDGYTNTFYSGYVYPQGSFKFEGMISLPEKDYGYLYSFHRAMKGTLDYVTIHTDAGDYDEWDHSTQSGTTLHLANSDENSLIVLDTEGAFIVVNFLHEGYADHLGDGIIDGVGDEWLSFTVSREELESAAECFDWPALEDAARGMDGEFKTREYSYDGPSAADTVELEEDVDLGAVSENDLYFIKLAYKDSIAPYIAGFKLIDYSLDAWRRGWIEFTGTPREALDWSYTVINGQRVYCRSLNLSAAGEGQWEIQNAFDMLPYQFLNDFQNLGTDAEPDPVYLGHELSGLVSASLYVQQTGRTYTIDSPEGIEQLKGMLRFNDHLMAVSDCEAWNPLYLSFDDGRNRMAYTNGDGSNGVRIFGVTQPYSLGMSIFELFGVPLEAAGYSTADGITKTYTDYLPSSMCAWVEYIYHSEGLLMERRVCERMFSGDAVRGSKYEYDDAGNLVLEYWYDENGNVSNTKNYEYDDQGKLVKRSSANDKFWELTEYIYDSQGRLTHEKYSSNEYPDGNSNASVYYNYDDQGNCRISMGYQG